MRISILYSLTMLLVSGPAAAITIDFQEFATTQSGVGALQTKGFSLSSEGSGQFYDYKLLAVSGGSSIAYSYCPDCTMVLEEGNGQLFSISSVDLYVVSTLYPAEISITGHLSGGGTIETLYTSILPWSGALQTVSFGSEWTGLTSVEFSFATPGTPVQHFVDNITLTAVPIPAAVWLFGSALAALSWLRSRQST